MRSSCTAMVLSQMIVDIMMSVCAASSYLLLLSTTHSIAYITHSVFYAVQAFALFNRKKVLLVFALAFGLATPIITLVSADRTLLLPQIIQEYRIVCMVDSCLKVSRDKYIRSALQFAGCLNNRRL